MGTVDKLGWFLVAQDRLEEAIAVLRLNVTEDPRSSRALESLGEAYIKAGKKELAISALRESLALNPANEALRSRLKQLE